MDKFELSELKGRELFKSLLESLNITDSQESTYKYDTADYYYKNKKELNIGVEIKTRNSKYEFYSTHLMEVKKYRFLLRKIKDKEIVNAVYANFFGDTVAYIYPLGVIKNGIEKGTIIKYLKWLPKTTAENKGYEWKEVMEIPKELGWRYELQNNKWIQL